MSTERVQSTKPNNLQHHYHENYSGRNPVPTVQAYEADLKRLQNQSHDNNNSSSTIIKSNQSKNDRNDRVSDNGLDVRSQSSRHLTPPSFLNPSTPTTGVSEQNASGSIGKSEDLQSEKQEVMKRIKCSAENPVRELELQGERIVRDPVTGMDVIIKDAALDASEKTLQSNALKPPRDSTSGEETRSFSPLPTSPGNICLQPFPPPVSTDLISAVAQVTNNISFIFLVGLAAIWATTAFGNGIWSFFWRTSLIGTVAVISSSQVGLMARKIEKDVERVRHEMHRQRGIKHSPPIPESTEWVNAFISTFMGLINPEMFLPLADTIEDVMQASLPSFIDAVKISDIGQGDTPVRILSMRALPDKPSDPEYPRYQWVIGDYDEDFLMSQRLREEQSGDYVNYEVAFAYQAQPGHSNKLRSHNIHLLVEFFVGIYDWVRVPIPVWIQVEGLSGVVRLRLQMIPESPYIRNLTFTMMGVPKISVSAKPMLQAIPNVLDLPIISGFVQSSIAAACAEYVAPKSMTINLQEMLSGSGIKESTHALGVIMVTLHHAQDLTAQDSNGYSDPYIVLAYAKFGKPLYSTRIITEELNPVFEETAFLLVSEDEVKAKEDLSVMLWDSDERSADDLVGRVHLSVSEIMSRPNCLIKRQDELQGFQDADYMRGLLTWSVGYFSKTELIPALQKQEERDNHEAEALGETQGPKTPAKKMTVSTMHTPPSPKLKSGILSVIIHHINNLERANLKGASGDREGAQGQDTSAPSEQDDNLPCAYCEIIVNDRMIYKTRVKQFTTMPFFEAGTEHFVRDWTETVVRVAVRDSRVREKDPLLGVINIDLEELFSGSNSSQVTQLFSLQEGVGFGRAKISVLFESVEANLPRNLMGWDTATLEITSPITAELSDEMVEYLKKKKKKLKLRTNEDTYSLSMITDDLNAESTPSNRISWTNLSQIQDYDHTVIRLPIYERYKSSVVIDIGSHDSTLSNLLLTDPEKHHRMSVLWLQTLEDDVEHEIRLPILMGKNSKKLRQNFLNDQTKKTHDYQVCGFVSFKARVDPGLDPEHSKYAQSSVARHTFEAYDNTEGQAEQAVRNNFAIHQKKSSEASTSSENSSKRSVSQALSGLKGILGKQSEEERALEAAHRKALDSRHRGVMQYGPVRTSIWMKEGISKRARDLKNRIRGKVEKEPIIETEGRG
ncbi:hypothetical protein PPACK8108_LOCUS7460 [Phakopsora pachyrhizi]|uniref:C2 domain-containing protein n=1 Tax=Phakopsora pachyrhizi TaxID=170000 RepID=A0AAV0ASX0_PHAPC|nr:hypothetical protein PPACK8108_LOCUS7460 [Phakopsora pachyrhizi]